MILLTGGKYKSKGEKGKAVERNTDIYACKLSIDKNIFPEKVRYGTINSDEFILCGKGEEG